MYGTPGGPQHTWSSEPAPHPPAYGGGYGQTGGAEPRASGTILKVFGILGISFGAINLLYNAVGILQAILQMRQFERLSTTPSASPGGAPFSEGAMQGMVDASLKLTLAHNTAMILMDVFLLAVGVLLLQRKEIGRKLAIVWAGLGLIVLVGRGVSFEIILMPYLDQMLSSIGNASENPMLSGGFFSVFARGATYIGLGVMAIWPITLLVSMNLSSTKAAIQQANTS